MAPSIAQAALAVLFASSLVHGAPNMTPSYEIHLLMNPSVVLGSDNKLTPTVLSTFAMPTSVTKMNVQFLDTDAKDIYTAGWSPRIRKMEGASDFDLTYKWRTEVSGGDINAALNTANADGFDASDTNYEAQIEWSYTKQTLSISRSKSDSKSGYSGMDLPSKKDSRKLLIDNAPGKFDDWLGSGWGTDTLAVSRIYGPVLAKRSIGTWNGTQLYIEVWPINNATSGGITWIVEASFKTNDLTTASNGKANLQSFLTTKGWFLAQDSLKTSLIMANY